MPGAAPSPSLRPRHSGRNTQAALSSRPCRAAAGAQTRAGGASLFVFQRAWCLLGPGDRPGDVVTTPDTPWAEGSPVAMARGWLPPQSPEATGQLLSLTSLCAVRSPRTPSSALELPQHHGSGDVCPERPLCPRDGVASAVPPAASHRKWARQGEPSPAAQKPRVLSGSPAVPLAALVPDTPGLPPRVGEGVPPATWCVCVGVCSCGRAGGPVSACVRALFAHPWV